jgi:hypothetical protein
MYERFLEILRLSRSGLNGEEIGRTLHLNNVRKYLTGEKMSFLTHLRAERERLGSPNEGNKWLPIQLKPRGTPGKEWVQVPASSINFARIVSFLQTIAPPKIDRGTLARYRYSSAKEMNSERMSLFGFLLGATVGDAGKRVKGVTKFVSRALSLELSENKPNSLGFGEFTSLCANASLNIRMHRVNDGPISDRRFSHSRVLRWLSMSSPIMSWVFNECLGLENAETTTYDSLRMTWILQAPPEFRIAFLQGISESDGWPDAGQDRVKMVSSPNTKLFKSILESVGCNPIVIDQPPVELLSITSTEAYALPVFNPRIRSNLYDDMETLARAKRYPERIRLSPEAINVLRELATKTTNANQVCLDFARKTGYKVSSRTVRKYTCL